MQDEKRAVRSALCGVRCAEYATQSALCGVRNAEVRYAEVRNAEVRYAEVRNAEVRYAEVRNAEVRNAGCGGSTIAAYQTPEPDGARPAR